MYELRVLSGLHRGAALPLIGQQWIIGNEEHSDLTLNDGGIQAKHCQLSLVEDGWFLETIQGTIADSEGHQVERVENFALNTTFLISGVWITIVDAETPWPVDPEVAKVTHPSMVPSKKSYSGIGVIVGFISAAAIVTTGAWAALTPEPVSHTRGTVTASEEAVNSDASSPLKIHSQVESNQKTDPLEPALPRLETVAELRYQLQKMLEERELDQRLGVQESQNYVTLVGEIDRSQNQRLERMLNRFNQKFETPHAVERSITIRKPSLPFKIKQITSGPLGSIITKEGKRLFVGDELNGIRLVAIQSDKVVFKGTKTFEIAW
ncbi:FHA domain-containing protein [Marinomonas balearica]|uniref:Type III secretion protein D n=1 Tax=Marinomonas balearica TaxID=491947 RepID=A0A4R6MC24_9GAMM|nr:FHA domain-containing protein [Marinomonas balearica]TDO98250.1 type III secretion protein D [Marinomonas balearica]